MTVLFTKRAREIAGVMPFAREVRRDAVNTFDRAMTVQICVEVSSWAFTHVVARSITTTANGANDDVSREIAFLDRMTKFVALSALTDERERIKNLSDARSAEHEHRVLGNVRKTGTVFVKE